jgi:hypothetical protein
MDDVSRTKKNARAMVVRHDDVVLRTMEITEANRTVLPAKQPVSEKKDAPAPVLHDVVTSQTMKITEANMALEKKESIPNRVTHIMKKPEFEDNDPYSGMWWVSPAPEPTA